MALSDYQVAIGALTLGPGTSYAIHSVEGFGLPDVRSTDVPRPRRHGEFFGLDFLPGRTITISATILGTTPSDVVSKIDALMDLWSPDAFPSDAASIEALTYKFPGQNTRQLRGRPRRASVDTSRIVGNRAEVVLEYRAADPLQYDDTLSSQAEGQNVAASGRSYPRVYPLSFGGGSSSGLMTCTNSGNFETNPVAHIVGPCTNPKVENVNSGAWVKFAIVLGATDYLDVDFDARTVILNGAASRYSTLTTDSAWWTLPPGSSSIRFSADTFNAASSLTLSWRSAWL